MQILAVEPAVVAHILAVEVDIDLAVVVGTDLAGKRNLAAEVDIEAGVDLVEQSLAAAAVDIGLEEAYTDLAGERNLAAEVDTDLEEADIDLAASAVRILAAVDIDPDTGLVDFPWLPGAVHILASEEEHIATDQFLCLRRTVFLEDHFDLSSLEVECFAFYFYINCSRKKDRKGSRSREIKNTSGMVNESGAPRYFKLKECCKNLFKPIPTPSISLISLHDLLVSSHQSLPDSRCMQRILDSWDSLVISSMLSVTFALVARVLSQD